MSTRRIVSSWLVALVLVGCASSSKVEAGRVRVVNDADLIRGCQVADTRRRTNPSVRHRSIVGEEGDDFCHVAAVNGIDVASSRRQRITLSQC